MPSLSLKPFHTFGFEHKAESLIEITSVAQLLGLVLQLEDELPIILGEGSNSIFTADVSKSVWINKILGKTYTEFDDHYIVEAMAGENWDNFVRWTIENNLFGLENLALIPGSVGACPVQNIGAYGVEIKDFFHSLEYINLTTGKLISLSLDELRFGYRDSIFKHDLKDIAIITKVCFKLPKLWQPKLEYGPLKSLQSEQALAAITVYNKICEVRLSKLPDPKVLGNAGSFFKNPVIKAPILKQILKSHPNIPSYPQANGEYKVAAGWLIEQAGFKGKFYKGLEVYHKQALVLTNHGQAESSSLLELASAIIAKVQLQFGIKLETEVRFIGSDGEWSPFNA
ncbi:UDP-N-acetylmuramate dehydrogenase [Paraferrimonas sp. SM1919]|uniref:UDP-N-acetylmuramate dehydrogenase n=1 Tax=Paraferrimonas sp. SM1919 TaxID=2662263 RepID=UPI0013D3ED25|nr:UDP-N-acetylmuramate dehydrogenase [Paraferrimonas sp. SM1919]